MGCFPEKIKGLYKVTKQPEFYKKNYYLWPSFNIIKYIYSAIVRVKDWNDLNIQHYYW